ncbi:hypothetical protein MMC25_005485 [Agyrium rufum]|nr:hypothetical protein [Agyrium rufum]
MQQLGINTIRVYSIAPEINHDECASIFNAAGIYMLLDVNSPLPNESLNPGDLVDSYNSVYLQRVFGVIESFKSYPNTLGFFSGNEDINDSGGGENVPPYLRAVTRDINNYIAKHSSRSIPVGYSAADVREVLLDTWNYLSCDRSGTNPPSDPSRIAFYGINSYSWCGDSSYQQAGYDVLLADFNSTSIPVFFSEYGCNLVKPRIFTEVQSLYSPPFTGLWSGGLVYEYVEEVSDFGLVVLNANGTASLRTDFDNLQAQLNKIDVKQLEQASAPANGSVSQHLPQACTASLITASNFTNSWDGIPDPPSGGQDLIDNGIPNPPVGKLVDVSNPIKASLAVYGTSGQPVPNLQVNVLASDQSNAPSGKNTSDSAAGGAASSSIAGNTATATSASSTPSSTAGVKAEAVPGKERAGMSSLMGLGAAVAVGVLIL